jgi:SAM-dependent methyltransferase
MREFAVEHYVCPESGAALDLDVTQREGDHIMEGTLTSTVDPTKVYAITRGIPRFVDYGGMEQEQKDTVDTFSFKWTQVPEYAFTQATKQFREQWYYTRFGFSEGDNSVRGFLGGAQRILEAGTGTGVDTDMLVRNSDGQVFGIDISVGIETAFERFRDNPRVALAQADIGRLPFRPNTFDVVSCDQVLHHTPTPPENFQKLVSLLTEHGRILLYVYVIKGALREFADDHLRALYTTSSVEAAVDFSERITRFGRNLSHLNAKVEIEDDLPEFGIKRGTYDVQRLIYDHIVKCFWRDDYDFKTNVMVNFDWYRPLHAFRYTEQDIREWCATAKIDIRHMDISPSGISIIAHKP